MRNEAGYWDATSGGTQYYRNDGTSARAWNKDVTSATLYARWTANQSYTITYDANGGNVRNMPSPLSETATVGVPYYISDNKPERDGYVFNGWTASNTAVGFSAVSTLITPRYWLGQLFTATANTTMKAQWVAERYEVKYDANGGSGAPDPDWQEHDKALTLTKKTPSRNGFRFIGWALSSSAVVSEIDGGVLRSQNAPTTVYAVWQKRIEITVNNFFDKGYLARYYGNRMDEEDMASAMRAINVYRDHIAVRYSTLLNLNVIGNSAKYFYSAIDECKGTVTTSNLNTLCNDKNPRCDKNHTNQPVLRNHFINTVRPAGNASLKNVLWTSHKTTPEGVLGFAQLYGTYGIITNQATNNRVGNSVFILLHELNHTLGAPDHYHDRSDDSSGCKKTGLCSDMYCNRLNSTKPRSNKCVMGIIVKPGDPLPDISSPDIICKECTLEISTRLRMYWFS